jgi:hypothetical protein
VADRSNGDIWAKEVISELNLLPPNSLQLLNVTQSDVKPTNLKEYPRRVVDGAAQYKLRHIPTDEEHEAATAMKLFRPPDDLPAL